MGKKIAVFVGIPLALLFGLGAIGSSNPKVQSSQVQGVSTTQPTSIPTDTPVPTLSPSPVVTQAPVATSTPYSSSTNNNTYYTNVDGNTVQSPTYYNSAPAGASAQCNDGTYSFSQNRRGTCSHHGGVAQWL